MSTLPTAEDDIELLRRIARGDRPALGALYDRHANTLLALGLRILRSRRELEDVAHDVFLEAWRCAGDYDPERGSVRTWLLLRMRSRCLDRLRSHAYSRVESLADGADALAADSSEEQAGGGFDHARLSAELSALPHAQRVVLELGYFRGLTFQQIADELGIPLGTVKSRVSTAMTKLRESLGAANGGNAA